MKTINIQHMVLAAAFILITGLVACNNDTTELAFRNSDASGGGSASINRIIWADGDAEWQRTDGWAANEETDSKSISVLNGDITAAYWDGSDFSSGTVTIENSPPEGSGDRLSLDEGASYVFTIRVN